MAIQNKRIQLTATEYLNHKPVKKDSIFNFLYAIIRLIIIIIQNIYCVSSYLILSWILLFPVSWFSRDLYYKIENQQYNALMLIVSTWSLAGDMKIVETGDDIKQLIDATYDDTLNEQNYNYTKQSQHSHKKKSNTNEKQLTNDHGRPLKSVCDNNGLCNIIADKYNNKQQLEQTTTDQYDDDDIEEEQQQQQQHIRNTNGEDLKQARIKKNDRINGTPNHTNHINNIRSSQESIYSSPSLSNTNTRKPRILFLCNHISTADVPLLMQAFSTTKNLSIFWVLDAQFKATNFGLVCGSHGDFFIAKNTFKDGALTEQVLKFNDRNVLALFPEGGFWRKRLDGSNRYALKNNLPMTKYVTHPRFGAFKDLIDPRVGVTHIVDATLLYDNIRKPVSILDIVLGTRNELVLLDCKIYDRNNIEPNEEWLRGIWLEKDKLMQTFYDNREQFKRSFLASVGKERLLRSARLDWMVVISIHLFYLLICYLTIYRLICSSNLTILKAKTIYGMMHNKYHLFMNSDQY